MRCFVAIELPAEIRSALARCIGAWRSDAPEVRFCREEQLHVTLRFFGEMDPAALDAVGAVIAEAAGAVSPFSLSLAGIGAFPDPRAARVLWFGVIDDARGCERWLELVQPGLDRLGFSAETRPFHPHITLARSRSAAGSAALRRILRAPADLPRRTMTVDRLALIESRIGADGAAYRTLARFPLGGPRLDAAVDRG
jgi:2'-5' RNA ligase